MRTLKVIIVYGYYLMYFITQFITILLPLWLCLSICGATACGYRPDIHLSPLKFGFESENLCNFPTFFGPECSSVNFAYYF